jgi:small subunit ribosomal protein S6
LASTESIAEYELVLMLDPETPDAQRETLAGDVRGRIEAAGELRHGETWGVRKLAYEIEKRNEADYRFFRFQAESPLLDELDHSLKIADGVLRFRVFGVDPRTPIAAPPPPVQAARPPRESRGGKPRRSDGDERGGERDAPSPAAEKATGAGADASPKSSDAPSDAPDASADAPPVAPAGSGLEPSSEPPAKPSPEAPAGSPEPSAEPPANAEQSGEAAPANAPPAGEASPADESVPAAGESAPEQPAADDAAEPKASE